VLLLLAVAGCGLADYEKKMREADARVQHFDEENKLLGDPLNLPGADRAPPVDVFLRPPRGVSKSGAADDPYHFAGGAGLCSDLYLMFGDAEGGKDKLEKQVEERFGAAGLNWQPVTVRPADRPALDFDAAEFADPRAPANAPAVCIAYVHQTQGRAPAGVVFRVAQPNRAGVEPTVKKSLESYAEAGDAAKARSDFAKRTGH
jgi:hypothetical protein